MPNVTKNYGLKKPLPEEFYDIAVQNENMDIIDEELKKKYDPKNKPTPTEIGAAPKDYISGTYIIEDYESLDELVETIYSSMPNRSVKMVLITDNSSSTWGGGTCLVMITRNSTDYGTADFFGYTHHGIVCRKSKRIVWEPLEWANPPMSTDLEYRTTERIYGKVVFKKYAGGIIQYRLEDETTWKPYAEAVGAVKKSGGTMTGTLTVPQAVIDDNILKGLIMAEGTSAKLQVIAQEKSSGRHGMLIVSPNGLYFLNEDGYEYPVYHQGNAPAAIATSELV